jgi:hypothetical protein
VARAETPVLVVPAVLVAPARRRARAVPVATPVWPVSVALVGRAASGLRALASAPTVSADLPAARVARAVPALRAALVARAAPQARPAQTALAAPVARVALVVPAATVRRVPTAQAERQVRSTARPARLAATVDPAVTAVPVVLLVPVAVRLRAELRVLVATVA